LRQERDAGAKLRGLDLARILAVEQHGARIRLDQRRESAGERALAAARRPLDGDGLSGPHLD
jgi:hypothetical protein